MISTKNQTISLIKKTDAVGVALPQKAGLDEVAAALAVLRVLEKAGKNTGLFFAGTIPQIFKKIFPDEELLPRSDNFLSDFIVKINHTNSPVKEMRYERTDSGLSIIITPKNEPIRKEHISFEVGVPKCDLIIAIGVDELAEIGPAFENSAELFYEKPIISFGISPNNETISEVGLNDPGRSSVSEIAGEFFAESFPEVFDEQIATLFLLGIITKTKNFRNSRTKPKTLIVAAKLLDNGGRLNDIVRILWKTKPLPLLKLWGRAAIRSRLDEENQTLVAILTKDDFVKTETQPGEALPFVMEHIEEHFALPKNFALLWQDPEKDTIRALVKNPIANADKKGLKPSPLKEGYLEFNQRFSSFQEAEEAFYKIIDYTKPD